jgi:2-(1,2-epoxy-1,2-dihydrophenyl)acetyl-CoA isomerase
MIFETEEAGMETILYEVSDDVATITLNRPEKLNPINLALAEEVAGAVKQAGADPAVRCLMVTGAGRGFCAGADLNAFQEAAAEGGRLPIGDILRRAYHPMIIPLVKLEKPVVAAVNGVAAGAGASLAFACDFRIAAEDARFIQAFVRIGLIPDSGANYFLPRLVGMAKAIELAMLGDAIDAQEALRLGLVTKVVPGDKLQEEARAFCERLAKGPTRAYALTKRALAFGSTNDLESTLEYEADLQDQLARTADVVEGVTAFLQKRQANFQGR